MRALSQGYALNMERTFKWLGLCVTGEELLACSDPVAQEAL